MNNIKKILLLSLVLFISSCQSSKEHSYKLASTNDSLVFELNPQTSIFIKALFPYTDENGKEYLTFQNNVEPEILWYDMNSQKYVKTLTLDKEGANGVGLFCGYYIHSENEIYIPEMMRNAIDVIDGTGKIIRKITYDKTVQGKSTIPFMPVSFNYTPLYIFNNCIYIPQSPNLTLEKTMEDSPVTLVLDTINNSLTEFELRFPPVITTEEIKGNSLGVQDKYSRCFNGEDFVYSFFFDEYIYVVSPDGKVRNKIQVKSQYLDKIYDSKKTPGDLNLLAKAYCEIPMYNNMIYDKYREVYYRFVYPETELKEGNYMDICQLGRTKFSIIILNKQFEILGETLFPENVYASRHFFIRKDGLYISTSFINNPNYSDDKLCFKRMDLIQ